ncbi:MAG: hypothetical protein ACLSAF_23450 [Intestinimonas sp.]
MEDSTNQDDAYTRNQVRHQVIPLLDEINPWFVPRMADTIRYLRSDNDYLSAQAAGRRPQGETCGRRRKLDLCRPPGTLSPTPSQSAS